MARDIRLPAQDPDHDIVGFIQEGNWTAALRNLMQRYGTAVYRYCREALRDSTLADDVQQQVFIQAYRDLPRFAGPMAMRTWLFTIARNRVLDAASPRQPSEVYGRGSDRADALDPSPSHEEIDDARLREVLVACIDKFNERTRTELLLRFQQGFTFEELGEVCREKPGTLQARVTRALPILRKCIEHRVGRKL